MKRFLAIFAVLLLAVWVWLKFQDYRRLHPPEDYEYQSRVDIDADYYDRDLVQRYFELSYDVGSFARNMWYSHSIDVRHADADNPQHRHAVNYYNYMKAEADAIALRLARSKELKAQGFENTGIQYMEENGLSPDAYRILQRLGGNSFRFDDQGQGVWEIQNRLISLGYTIPHDGIYKTETQSALKDWQSKNELYPSGVADWETLYKLFK